MKEPLVVENLGQLYGPFTEETIKPFLKKKSIRSATEEEKKSYGVTHIKSDGSEVRVRTIRPETDFDLPF